MEIRLRNGRIRGKRDNAMWAFLNIPFGRPPLGSLRFRPPAPVGPWQGVLDCTALGTRPLQNPPPWSRDRDRHRYGEDCLNLNVWTPAADDQKRPVVVFLFGGGHVEGSNSEQNNDGPHFISTDDVVMVAPNYRIGALGYLYLGEVLGAEFAHSGDMGLRDQILALEWVRDNIAAFGGDPGRVTLLGQSAGAKSVMSLLVSPLASGLFHRVIAMSGGLQIIKDTGTATALTRNFLAAMGLPFAAAHRVLDAPPERILAAQAAADATYYRAEAYGPTANGYSLPLDVQAYIRAGNLPRVPVLMGHTKEELFLLPEENQTDPGDEAVRKKLGARFGLGGSYVFERYLELRKRLSYAEAYGSVATRYTYAEGFLRTASLLVESGLSVYAYRWDFRGGSIAHHSADIEAAFGSMSPVARKGYEEACDRVSSAIREAWLTFIKTGVPAAAGLQEWPAYGSASPAAMAFDTDCRLQPLDVNAYDTNMPLQVMRLAP